MDMITYMRTEWVSAALCTNQTPRSANIALQIGVQDGRSINFLPRTIQSLITSSCTSDGVTPVSAERQLRQAAARRENGPSVDVRIQRADLLEMTPDDSVDVVISLQACTSMAEGGIMDWQDSVRQAARVLRPGGRLLFCEATTIDGIPYTEMVQNLVAVDPEQQEVLYAKAVEEADLDEQTVFPLFDQVGFDDVDLVLEPHVAGIAIKAMDAGLTMDQKAARQQQEEQERMADISIQAFGNKRRKKRKKKVEATAEQTETKKS